MMRFLLFWLFLSAGLALVASLPSKSGAVQHVPAVLQQVEAQRGQPLTPEQRREFSHVAAGLRDALFPIQQQFARTVARAFNLPQGQVLAVLPGISAHGFGVDSGVIPKIEASLGRAVTSRELHQVRVADNAQQAEISAVVSRFAQELGQISGLSKDQMRRILSTTGI